MCVIDHEMNGNGGCNWVESNYIDYLDILRENLMKERGFSGTHIDKIRWSLDEIIACGRELTEHGESARNATDAVDYLIFRVVDWCNNHPSGKG